MQTPETILDFWLNEVGPKGWYDVNADLDAEIRDRFLDTWKAAQKRGCDDWQRSADATLAFIILTDQFPRNMFRGQADAFATDSLACKAAKLAISRKWDMRTKEPARQFFYMPLMHSENLVDQDRCVRLVLTRMPDGGDNTLLHARGHRHVIRKFGRFPFRNDALGRNMRADEQAFMDAGAYGAVMRNLRNE